MMPDPGVGKFPPNEENVRSVIEELMVAKFKVLSAEPELKWYQGDYRIVKSRSQWSCVGGLHSSWHLGPCTFCDMKYE